MASQADWQECLLPELTACAALWQSPELYQRAAMAVRELDGVADLPCLCVTQTGERSCKHHVSEFEHSQQMTQLTRQV